MGVIDNRVEHLVKCLKLIIQRSFINTSLMISKRRWMRNYWQNKRHKVFCNSNLINLQMVSTSDKE